MINKKVFFRIPNQCGSYCGTVVDKVLVPHKVYEHKPTTAHSSYNPEYKQTVEVNAYVVEDTCGNVSIVMPENILSIKQ